MSLLDHFMNLPTPVLDHWGYWIVLFSALMEAVPVFGIFIPGQTIIIAAGFMTKLGMLEFGDVVMVSALGVIIGDSAGYLLGRWFGHPLILKWGKYFLLKESHYKKVESLMHAHTAKTLIFGRFNSLTRALAPFVAGSTHVPFQKFFIINIIGGICWAIVFVSIGHIFGIGFYQSQRHFGRYAAIAIVAVVVIFLIVRRLRRRCASSSCECDEPPLQ